jgi:phosphoribosylformylglycinamidine synthase
MPKYEIYVTYREGIFDPAGATARRGLEQIGFEGIADLKIGKYIRLDADATPAQVQVMCEKLLANPVIEDFRIVEG